MIILLLGKMDILVFPKLIYNDVFDRKIVVKNYML